MSEDISRLDLERFVLGELPPDRTRALEDRLKSDARLRREVEEIEKSNGEILKTYPAPLVAARIRSRIRPVRPRPDRRLVFLVPALAAAALLAVILLPGRKPGVLLQGTNPVRDETIIKGTAGLDLNTTHLLVYRKRGEIVEELADGILGRPGDILQMAYVSNEKFGMIFSIDGAGTVSPQFPDKAESCVALELKQKTLLPLAVELDEAPRFERIFFVTSESPIDGRVVWAAARALAGVPERAEKEPLALPAGLYQVSFLVLK